MTALWEARRANISGISGAIAPHFAALRWTWATYSANVKKTRPALIALFLALSGYLFALILASAREASLRGLVQNVSVLYLFIVPAISMRLLAEEQRTGTIELLLTNPVQEWEIVTGKFLASIGKAVKSMPARPRCFPRRSRACPPKVRPYQSP